MIVNRRGVHLLVDVDGYADNGKHGIFVEEPAALQIAYLGTSASHGAQYLQYIGIDRWSAPPEFASQYEESLWYMPYTFQINSHRMEEGLGHFDSDLEQYGVTRAEAGLPSGATVLMNFNQYHKVSAEDFAAWLRILRRTNNTVLWLLQPRRSESAAARLRAAAQTAGLGDRIVFAEEIPMHMNLQRLRLADVSVDTRVYGAVSTATDILWAAVPLISTPHLSFVSRAASAILVATGMAALVARTDEDFEDLSVAVIAVIQRLQSQRAAFGNGTFASQSSRRNPLRRRLQRRVYLQPHFDTQTWVRAWETNAKMAWDLRLELRHLIVKGAAVGSQLRMPHLVAAQRYQNCPGDSYCTSDGGTGA